MQLVSFRKSWDFGVFHCTDNMLTLEQCLSGKGCNYACASLLVHFLLSQLYSWGCGPCLGSGSADTIVMKPTMVEELTYTRVVDVSSGDGHCLALTHCKYYLETVCLNSPTLRVHCLWTMFVLTSKQI